MKTGSGTERKLIDLGGEPGGNRLVGLKTAPSESLTTPRLADLLGPLPNQSCRGEGTAVVGPLPLALD